MNDIVPGIGLGAKDFDEIIRKVNLVAGAVEWVQIDFADETFVPVKTLWEFDKFANLIANYKDISFEAHLMVDQPEKYSRELSKVGFKRIIAHVECNDPRLFLDEARYESAEVGLAIDGATPLEQIEPYLEELDVVLVMMAEAGASGKQLDPENVEKVKAIRGHFPDLTIEVDQGINDQTIKIVKDAGANRFVSSSFIFRNSTSTSEVAAAVEALKMA